jgi:hypothetical protein
MTEPAPTATPGRSALVRVPYTILRGAHLLWTVAVPPLALYHVQSATHVLGEGDMLAIYIGGSIWMLMYIGLDQFAYPVTLLGAFFATGSVALNVVVSIREASAPWTFGAYVTFLAALFAQTLMFGGILGLCALVRIWPRGAGRRASELHGIPLWYLGFLAAVFAFEAFYAVRLSPPLIDEVLGLAALRDRIFLTGAFLGQIVFGVIHLFQCSIFSVDVSGAAYQEQNRSFERWTPAIGIGLVVSIVACLFAAMN